MRLALRASFLLLGLLGCVDGDATPPTQGIGTGGSSGQGGAGQGGAGQGGAGQGGVSGSSGQGGAGASQGGAGQAQGGAGASQAGAGQSQGGAGMSQGGAGGEAGASAGQSGGAGKGGGADGTCPVQFSTTVPAGATNPRIAGEWNNFSLDTATPLAPGAGGKVEATVQLPPGLQAYKVIYEKDGQTQWVLDPEQGRRKYLGSPAIENSAIKVRDCSLPSFAVSSWGLTRAAAGQGEVQATLAFSPGASQAGAGAIELSLRQKGKETPLDKAAYTIDAQGKVTLSLKGLADGKYRVTAVPVDADGKKGEPLLMPFWVEAEAFDWRDALVYMVMTDRFRDGDPGNNAPKVPGAEGLGDFLGGDLEGLRQVIASGTLDQLGVRAIWLSPFQTNPQGGYKAADGVHVVTGYHGYWPTRAREVDARLGGPDALHAVVEEAHAHGIRILQDYVVNHVHEEHEYFKQHPEWFRTGCVCGTDGCGWTEKALECLFAGYLPDINHSVPEANAQFVDDAVFWLDQFDLDGLRVDAVKHVEEVATRNLAAEVRERFETSGTRYFMMGETAMGWGDCPDPCNDENYGTISRYIGPQGLDGQFDFVLYHGVSYRVFASNEKGMLHADYWTEHGQQKWPAGSIMTPYIGSHDTPRFLTLADPPNASKAGNQWSDASQAPGDSWPYKRMRVAMSWMLGLPGAPLLYYGDEYGQWGGSDPNNRLSWRDEGALNGDEKETLALVRKLGQARRSVPALRRGAYVSFGKMVDQPTVSPDTLENAMVFGRKSDAGEAAIVGVNRSDTPRAMLVRAQQTLGIAPGTSLKDALGGPSVAVEPSGLAKVTIPPFGAVVLSP